MSTVGSVGISELQAAIRNVPDFPKPGIQFKDITPVLGDARLFRGLVHHLTSGFEPGSVDAIAGIDARGFIFGGAMAIELNAAFVPIRKQGKLPYRTHEARYDLEYGSTTIAIHVDAVRPGSKVILIDDVLATGGTAAAAMELLKRLGAEVLGAVFFIELEFLKGREKLRGVPVRSLVAY